MWLFSHPWQFCHANIGALSGGEWDPEMWDGGIWVDEILKIQSFQTSLIPLGLQKCSFFCQYLVTSILEDDSEASVLKYCTSSLTIFSHLSCCRPMTRVQFNSVRFSHSVMSNSLRPHELQHARPPCPSPTPRVYTNSCPLSWWCHPTISSSVIPFFSCLQSFQAWGSFLMSRLFTSGSQSIGVSTELFPTLCDPMDCSPPGSSVHGDSPGRNTGDGW